ncbi:MAG: hypothetical protein ACTSO7_11335 [Candidatus Heimdallarchaeota archaeon]
MASSYKNDKVEKNQNLYYWLYYLVFGPLKVIGKIKHAIFHFSDLCECAGDVAEVATESTGESSRQKSSSCCCCCCDCCCDVC